MLVQSQCLIGGNPRISDRRYQVKRGVSIRLNSSDPLKWRTLAPSQTLEILTRLQITEVLRKRC